MPGNSKEKTLDAVVAKQGREEGADQPLSKGSIVTSIPHPSDNFDALFVLNVGHTRVWVQPASRPNGESVIELTDDHDSNLLMKPTEALAVAAALQAVAVHVLEAESKLGAA